MALVKQDSPIYGQSCFPDWLGISTVVTMTGEPANDSQERAFPFLDIYDRGQDVHSLHGVNCIQFTKQSS